jgi:hypothetical protein
VPDLGNGDAVTIKPNTHHIVLDHLSLSWSTDETVSIYGTDVTVQWNFITESLNCAGHPRGCHSKGFFVPGPATRVSVLHNLVAHHVDRNPFIRAELEDAPNDYQYVNNVFYNYHIPTLIETLMPTGTIRIDWVGNFYKRGRNTGDFPAILLASRRLALFRGTLALHLEGNVGPPRDSEAERDAVMMQRDQEHYGRAARHFPPPSSETDAQAAFSAVLERAGATLPCRDVVDQRVATEARAGLGRIINDPLEGGGYPILRCAS